MFKNFLKGLLIPCEENKFRPDFLERMSVGIMLALILLSFSIANLQALLWMGSDWMVSTILPAVIVDLTNNERNGEHLIVLTRSDLLDKAAQLKAEDMAKNEYFAHYSPTGISPWYWFDQVSYDYVHAGENLAVHFTDSNEVVNAWMKSPSHRANIMDGGYTEIGVGTAKGQYKGFPTIFVVQLFGTPNVKEVQKTPISPASAEVAGVDTSKVSLETVSMNSDEASTTTGETVSPATIETVPVTKTPKESVKEIPTVETTTATNTEGSSVATAAEETVVLYSDMATSSRPGIPAVVDDTASGNGNPSGTNFFVRGAMQPTLWLQFVYGLLALIVTIALILSVVIEWRRQHPIQIVYATGLLAVMMLLFYIHVTLTSGVTIV